MPWVKLRLLIAAALAAVAAVLAAGLWVLDSRVEPEAGGNATAAWTRENVYLSNANVTRINVGTDLRPQIPVDWSANPDRIRILVVGDSSTWGHGAEDLDMRWPARLQEILDERTAPGAIEVVVIAENGASTVLQAEWLTPALIEQINPDLIVIAQNANDVAPSGREVVFCGEFPNGECPPLIVEDSEEYRECNAGGYGNPVLMEQAAEQFPEIAKQLNDARCDPVLLREATGLPLKRDILDDPKNSAYYSAFTDALATIVTNAGNRPVVRMSVAAMEEEMRHVALLEDAWRNAGYVIAEMPRMSAAIVTAAQRRENFDINPGNSHPGPVATLLMALDVADVVLPLLPSERLDAATANAVPPKRPLLSNYLPVGLQLGDHTPRSVLVINGDPKAEHTVITDIAGLTTGEQSTPCATLGRPHGRLMFNPQIQTGTVIELTMIAPQTGMFELSTVGYDRDGRQIIAPAGTLKAGTALTVTTGPEVRGVLIAVPTGNCDVKADLHLPPFRLLVSRS